MLKKRLIGVVTVLNGKAVQSFSFNKYLPLGSVKCVVENLDRWGADEILVLSIDRSLSHLGPDLHLIDELGNLGVRTPICFGGGLRNSQDATDVIQRGADRIVIDSLVWDNPSEAKRIADQLGVQAIIASVPVVSSKDGWNWFNYRDKSTRKLSQVNCQSFASEILVIDALNEGGKTSLDASLVTELSHLEKSLIMFGGISSTENIHKFLVMDNVSAVGVGNYLNYKETSIQQIRQELGFNFLRPPFFSRTGYDRS